MPKPTSLTDDRKFLESVIGQDFLEKVLNWINRNLTPNAVFDETDLTDWANNNSFAHIDNAEKLRDFASQYDPEELYSLTKLENWAKENGFVKE